jgi:hypothetical protein
MDGREREEDMVIVRYITFNGEGRRTEIYLRL